MNKASTAETTHTIAWSVIHHHPRFLTGAEVGLGVVIFVVFCGVVAWLIAPSAPD